MSEPVPPPLTFPELDKRGVKLSKGRWILALTCAASRIGREDGEGPHPKPRDAIERAAYEFLKRCMTGDVAYVKELADRLDGKPAQAIELTGDPERPLFISSADELRTKLRGIIQPTETDVDASSGHTLQ